jgi:hypothetical protein
VQSAAQETPQNFIVKISEAGVKLAKKPDSRAARLAESRELKRNRELRRREKKARKLAKR